MYTVHILYKMYPAPVYDCIRLIRLVVPLDSSNLLRMGHPTPPSPPITPSGYRGPGVGPLHLGR